MAGRDWVRVQEIGDDGLRREGSRKYGCTHYLEVTSEVVVKMRLGFRSSNC
jgi:hypothetical protein